MKNYLEAYTIHLLNLSILISGGKETNKDSTLVTESEAGIAQIWNLSNLYCSGISSQDFEFPSQAHC